MRLRAHADPKPTTCRATHSPTTCWKPGSASLACGVARDRPWQAVEIPRTRVARVNPFSYPHLTPFGLRYRSPSSQETNSVRTELVEGPSRLGEASTGSARTDSGCRNKGLRYLSPNG